MSYDIFHKYGFNKINDDNSLNESFSPCTWSVVAQKSVPDFDGFYTDYVWYTNGEKHIFMFGDSDFITADPDYADWECETEAEAREWFDSYNGFDTEDEIERFEFDECTQSTSLNEAYNNLPTWFTEYIDKEPSIKRVLVNRGIDLANATYTKGEFPRSNRDPVLRDPTRLTIFRLQDGRGQVIYIVGVNDPWIVKPGSTWDREYASKLPMKAILEKAIEYGYIDCADPDNRSNDVRRERALLKQHTGPVRGKGQYPVTRNKYAQFDDYHYDYSKVIGTEIEWVTARGEDKSGYPLNPDKYIKMLDNVGLDQYSKRLETYYNKIEGTRAQIISILSQLTPEVASTYRATSTFGYNAINDVGEATSHLGKAIKYYQDLKTACGEIVSADISDERKSEKINSKFAWDAKYLRDELKEASILISKIQAAKLGSSEE